jgi:hypothetical protein
VDAQILATLTGGATLVATFHDAHGDGDDDDDKDKDGDKDDDDHVQHAILNAKMQPNPLNPTTQVSFTMAHEGPVHVAVYDMQGRLVKRLLNEYRASGSQSLAWDGTNEWNARVMSGVYFVRIQAPEGAVTRAVSVVR